MLVSEHVHSTSGIPFELLFNQLTSNVPVRPLQSTRKLILVDGPLGFRAKRDIVIVLRLLDSPLLSL